MRQPAWAAPQTAAPHRLPGARAGRRSRPAWADASVARGCVRARVGGSGEEGGGLQAHKAWMWCLHPDGDRRGAD